MEEVIGMGAEATVTRTDKGVRKYRLVKSYRHPEIDRQLRESRTKAEARLIAKASAAGVPVPRVEIVDESTLLLEEVKGKAVKEVLDYRPELAEEIGRIIARLHDANLIHADLTTSNMIFTPEERIVLIDFGLSYHSRRIEDKAVDVHLFKQALESKHYKVMKKAYKHFLKGYDKSPNAKQILERLKAVERRGRNKGS